MAGGVFPLDSKIRSRFLNKGNYDTAPPLVRFRFCRMWWYSWVKISIGPRFRQLKIALLENNIVINAAFQSAHVNFLFFVFFSSKNRMIVPERFRTASVAARPHGGKGRGAIAQNSNVFRFRHIWNLTCQRALVNRFFQKSNPISRIVFSSRALWTGLHHESAACLCRLACAGQFAGGKSL